MITINHDLPSLKVHALTFRAMARGQNGTPGMKNRLMLLADKYEELATIEASPNSPPQYQSDIRDEIDLPVIYDYEHEIDWTGYKSEGYTLFAIELVTPDMQPVNGTKIAKNTIWDFIKTLEKTYPDAPHGITAWIATAHKNDAACFYQAITGKLYRAYLE